MRKILPFVLQGFNLFTTAILGILFLPVLSRILIVEEVGLYSQILAIFSLALLVSGAGTSNYNYRFLNNGEFKYLLNSIKCFVFFLLASIFILGVYLSLVIKLEGKEFIVIISALILFSLFKFIHSIFYANQKHLQFVSTNLIEASTRYIFAFFILILGGGYLSYFYSNLVSAFIVLIISLIYIFRFSKWNIILEKSEQNFTFALKYSSTFMFSGIAIWILTSVDILLIGYLMGSSHTGIYSMGYTLGFQSIIFVLMIINNVVEPKLLSKKRINNQDYLQNIDIFVVLSLPIILTIEKSNQYFFSAVFSESYSESSSIMFMISFSSLLWGIFKLSSIKFARDLKEFQYLKAVSIAAVTNAFFNLLLINIIGIKGAAISSILSYTILAFIGMKSILSTKKILIFFIKYIVIYLVFSIGLDLTLMKIKSDIKYYILIIFLIICLLLIIIRIIKKYKVNKI